MSYQEDQEMRNDLHKQVEVLQKGKDEAWKPEIPRPSESTSFLLRHLREVSNLALSPQAYEIRNKDHVIQEGPYKGKHVYLSNSNRNLTIIVGDKPKGPDGYNGWRYATTMVNVSLDEDGDVGQIYTFDPKGMQEKYGVENPGSIGWGKHWKDYKILNPNTVGLFEPYMQAELKEIYVATSVLHNVLSNNNIPKA